MSPLLEDGDEVFVDPGAYESSAPRVGDVVLSAHPIRTDTKLIKTVTEVRPDGAVTLVGENGTSSTDSRSFGPVPADHIRGRVVSRAR